jgi:uncharacterized protein (DUF1330 family)
MDTTMSKAYWINTFRKVSDVEKLAAYVELAGPVMREFGGRFLARGQPARAFEAGVIERTVLIEFPSVEQAVAAYESPGYQRALEALGDGAERDIRIIEAASPSGAVKTP